MKSWSMNNVTSFNITLIERFYVCWLTFTTSQGKYRCTKIIEPDCLTHGGVAILRLETTGIGIKNY